MENPNHSDPFAAACLQARLQVPLEPTAESVPMPETPQIGDEIRSTFGEFKGVENKENPGSDPGITHRIYYDNTNWPYGTIWHR